MAKRAPEDRPLNIQGLLGVGLDGRKGETYITRGENFYLYGGSKKTHERMQEIALRFNEKVDGRGKRLPEINARELGEISEEMRDDLAQ